MVRSRAPSIQFKPDKRQHTEIQAQPQPRLPRNRDSLQIVDEQAAGEMAIFHEKQRQAYDDKEHKVWTKQGVGTLESDGTER